MKAPEFWLTGRGPWPVVLSPAGCLYALGGRLRHAFTRTRDVGVPVICIGNLTAGGTGKTPLAIAIANLLREGGRTPHILTRGHGGTLTGPVRVDGTRHKATETGDEALLLARAAPTWVARDRIEGAHAAINEGADTLILDDGFQDPALKKDVALVVIDGATGFGNGRVIPAGPLRETVGTGLARADGVVIMGRDEKNIAAEVKAHAPGIAVFGASLRPCPDTARLAGETVFGFAGIGRPEKFRDTLKDIGCRVAGFRAFADHHVFSAQEIAQLRRHAAEVGARLVTTAKDAARLGAEAQDMEVVEIVAELDDAAGFARRLGLSPS